MPLSTDVEMQAPWYDRLFQPVYRVKDAARYTGVHSVAVARWLRRGDSAWWDRERGLPLSYLELVEVAFATHFRSRGVPFDLIRNARQDVARHFGSSHPFAEVRFKNDGYRVLSDYYSRESERVELIDTLWVRRTHTAIVNIGDVSGPLDPSPVAEDSPGTESGVWFDLIEEKSSEFDYDFGLALTWYPEGKSSSVTIDPRMSFGDPAVGGISTWVIKGRWEAGESLEVLEDDYGLPGKALEDALRFEGVDVDFGR